MSTKTKELDVVIKPEIVEITISEDGRNVGVHVDGVCHINCLNAGTVSILDYRKIHNDRGTLGAFTED